jgi:hypothetical protein
MAGRLLVSQAMGNETPHLYPDGIAAEHVEEVAAWRRHASPLSLVIFGAVVALALSGFLGHERDWEASSNGTSLRIHQPEIIRNGEFLELRIGVDSADGIGSLAIGIDQALWEDLTINTMIPAASEESSEDGEFRFTFGQLQAGGSFLLKVDAQINPDFLGGNAGQITVYDGDDALVSTTISMDVLP